MKSVADLVGGELCLPSDPRHNWESLEEEECSRVLTDMQRNASDHQTEMTAYVGPIRLIIDDAFHA